MKESWSVSRERHDREPRALLPGVLRHRQHSRDFAVLAAILADEGTCPLTNDKVFDNIVKHVPSLMY